MIVWAVTVVVIFATALVFGARVVMAKKLEKIRRNG